MSFELLSAQSIALGSNYPDVKTAEDEAWKGSPFDWFRKKPSATKGKIGRDLAVSLLDAAGFSAGRKGVGLDVNGTTIRVKTSLIWGVGEFMFEQFRDTEFDFALCLGLFPDRSYGWFIPKDELISDGNMQERDGLKGQHGGAIGATDFWLKINPAEIPDWLAPYGGTTDAVMKAFKKNL